MIDRLRKTERLINIWVLLLNKPYSYTTKDFSEKFEVNVKTIYRDLDILDVEFGLPIQKKGTKWGVDESGFLPPIQFSIPEALNIFLAARLMLGYSHRYDPNVDATFTKLSSVLPPALREQINKTMDWMQKLPKDEKHLRILATVAEAWVSQHMVKIIYRSLPAEKATERIIEPYFIEPATPGHSSYVIAYCHLKDEIRMFKIVRIEAAELTPEHYTIPPDFDANEFFSSSLGIVVEGDVETIRLKFASEIARIIEETMWHPSQVLEKQTDGSVIMTLRVTPTIDLYNFVLQWGEKVEVLKPPDLRQNIIETVEAMLEVYSKK